MRIAHILSSFDIGGQERVAQSLARAQRSLGHEVSIISLGPEGPLAPSLRSEGVMALSVQKQGRVDPRLPWKLADCLREGKIEIVHTHNPAALVYGAPAARIARLPVLHTKHGVNPDGPRRMWLRRRAAALVDAYVAVTPALAVLARRFREYDGRPVLVVPNGVELGELCRDRTASGQLRFELGIPQNAWVVGHVGRLAREKHQSLLLDAMPTDLGERAHLVIVGDGPERQRLLEHARRARYPRNVHLTGGRNDVPHLLSGFDVFALSSDTEGLPLALLEAMASELPVVATCVGGVPDVVEHGVTGLLVAPGDARGLCAALRQLAMYPARARELARRAGSRVRARYSVGSMVSAYQALYEDVMTRRRLERIGALAGVR